MLGYNDKGQTNVPEQVYRSYGKDQDLNSNPDGEKDILKKEIVSLVTGNKLSGGVDTEGELHLWGKSEYAVFSEK